MNTFIALCMLVFLYRYRKYIFNSLEKTTDPLQKVEPSEANSALGATYENYYKAEHTEEIKTEDGAQTIEINSSTNYSIKITHTEFELFLEFIGQPGSWSDFAYTFSINENKIPNYIWGDSISISEDHSLISISYGKNRITYIINLIENTFTPMPRYLHKPRLQTSSIIDSANKGYLINANRRWFPISEIHSEYIHAHDYGLMEIQ
jgi:hypothetical protein